MVWNFAEGMITATQGLFVQTMIARMQRENVLYQIQNQWDLEESRQAFQGALEGYRIASQFTLQERQQAFQGALEGLKIDAQIAMQTSGQEFQAALEGVRQKFNRELEDYRQFCENARLQKRQDFEAEQLARRLQHEQRLEEYRRETQFILSRVQLLNALELADDKEIRETFPLKTPASVILKAYKGYQNNYRNIPLLVIISPPALEFEKFPNAAQGFSRIESRLTDEVQEFCKHYPLTSQERPVRYQGADWESKSSHGKSAVDVLHHVLQSIPTLVLESKVDGDLLRIYLAGWDLLETVPHYEKVLTIPWKEVLYPIARQFAEKWREYRMMLLDKGKSLEEIQRRGGDDELNLLILEEEEEDREFGFTGNRDYKYNVKEEKYIQELAQFLGICHCILVGLMADRYHFCHADVCPKLPELLPSLLEKVPSEGLKQMLVGEIVSSYQSLYQLAGCDRPHLIPDLYLDLALSLSHLPDQSWARKQIKYSIQVWLMLRNRVSSIEEQKLGLLELLERFTSALRVEDKEYVEKLGWCLEAVGESQHKKMFWEEMQRKEAKYKRKLENASVVCTLTGHSSWVNSVAISRDGQTVVSGSHDKTIKIWQLSTGKELRTLTGHSDSVESLVISPDGQTVVSGSWDNTIKIWELSTGRELCTLTGHSGPVNSVTISPDGQILVSGSGDETIKIWQLSTSKKLRTLTGHSGWVNSVAISPDGQTVVSGSRDKTIKIWELSTGRKLCTLTGHSDQVNPVVISPDGQALVSSSWDKTIKIWELSTGKELRTLTRYSDSVNSLVISPDGQTVVSNSGNLLMLSRPGIKIWQLSTGEELGTLTGHSNSVKSLVISPDGQTLVSGSQDNTIKIWRVV
ncbi:WD40 repeat domain-containing protein [Planktothrix mougeotii]|uniref:WD40 repeat domain-containing protein n=1 Tax=Planktothrix mougeotii LEGE 06226 TaxID=1828728 RepID=A0ABR9UFH1_9CYAN|nr:WD40 repeat domain-containing protein [Planktothrix mougeotii]MBE9145208.1 WD40 repeat domain-containing protein [Planktothrix mougeotii LEGE 06226]